MALPKKALSDFQAIVDLNAKVGKVRGVYTKAGLPLTGVDGWLARLSDDDRSPQIHTGTQWASMNGAVYDLAYFGAKGNGSANDFNAFADLFGEIQYKGLPAIVRIPHPKDFYLIDGNINIERMNSLIIEGAGAKTGFGNLDHDLKGAIVFTGLGVMPPNFTTTDAVNPALSVTQPSFINARSSGKIAFRNLRILYTNPLFTGDVIDFSAMPAENSTENAVGSAQADTQDILIDNCEIRGSSGYPTDVRGARTCVNLFKAIIATIRGSQFSNAKRAIVGKIAPGYSNVVNIENNLFLRTVDAPILNGEQSWNISRNVFEPTYFSKFGAYEETAPSYGPINISENWCGDAVAAGNAWFYIKGNHTTISKNLFGTPDSEPVPDQACIIFDCTGGSIDSVTLISNQYARVKTCVETKTTGAPGSIRMFSSYSDRVSGGLGIGATNYLVGGAGAQIINRNLIAPDTFNNEFGQTTFGRDVRMGFTGVLADFINKTTAFIGRIENAMSGAVYGTLAIIGYTNDDGVESPIQLWTGAVTPEKRLEVSSTITAFAPLKIGASGYPLKIVSIGFYELNFPNIPAHSSVEMTIPVTMTSGSAVVTVHPANYPAPIEAGLSWNGYHTSLVNDQIIVRLSNITNADINPATQFYMYDIRQY